LSLFNTLLLDTEQWDLVLDASGNIAMAQPPYAVAQDMGSAVRTFKGEVYYDGDDGIPYFEEVLGQLPPAALLTQLITNQALTVPGTLTGQTTITSFDSANVTGQIQATIESGEVVSVNF
jgi:hypothetical protein